MPDLNNSVLLLLAPGALCAGALLQLLLARVLSSRGKGVVAFACALPALLSVAALLPAIRAGHVFDAVLGTWDGPLAIVLHVDALSALFALMGTLLGALVLLYSIGYMAHDPAATRFYATMLLFIGGFVGLVYSANLFLAYLCWEIIGLCSFSLVGFWYQKPEAVAGARKVLLMTHVAGYGLLAAIVILYLRAGTAIWTDPAIVHSFSTSIFLLMLVSLIAKSVQVPLHTWIPDAMAAPTPVSSLLHAACYVTAGVYLAARMHSFGPWLPAWNATLIAIATVTIAVGVMYALVESDLKRMLAFSTVSQIGYMLLGIGIGTPLGIMAGLLHCLNHGFFKGGLFLNAGAVQHATGTRDMNQLGGLASRMPRTTLFWFVGVANMAGIPLMSGFISKWMLYAAALQAGWAIPGVVAWIASLGTVFVCAKATSAVFLGPQTAATRDAHEANSPMKWAMGLMAAGSIVLGVAPQIAVILFFQPMLSGLGLASSIRVSWLGMFSGAGTFSTAGGLILAIVSLVVGLVIFVLARGSRSVQVVGATGGAATLSMGGGVFTGGEPLWEQDHLTAQDFSRIFEQNWQSFFRWTNVDRAYAFVFHQTRATARLLAQPVAWLEKHALSSLIVLAAAILLAARLIGQPSVFSERVSGLSVPELLTAALCLAGVALICAAAEAGKDSFLPLQLALCGALCISGCMASGEWSRLALLESASLLTAFVVWIEARSRSAALAYLAIVVLSGVCFTASTWLSISQETNWSRACLLTGVCLKLALVPLLFWLLRLADELPAPLLGFILAVVDMAAVGELYLRSQSDPGLFTPAGPWLVIAVLSSIAAALLMLAQHSIKRLLVLSSIEDCGFLILGVASASTLGRQGLLFAAASHALAKSLLFVSLAAPERDGALTHPPHALATRYPISAFGFLTGMLAMLGIPPMLSFAGRWRLYATAFQIHPLLFAGFVLASVLALFAYVTMFTSAWWGSPRAASQTPQVYSSPPRHEPFILRIAIVALSCCLLLAGLWPQFFLQGFPGGRP